MGEDLQHLPESASDGQLSLSALLSQALVAYTIEVDNEFEHRMPHRTASFGSTGAGQTPWLISLAMWENCLRYLIPEGVTIGELERLACLRTNLDGMRRWGYITIEPDTFGSRSKRPRPDAVLRPTQAGQQAQEVWRRLPGQIEQRWRDRFSEDKIGRLRQSLSEIVIQVKYDLPDFLPILSYGLFTRGRQPEADRSLALQDDQERQPPAATVDATNLSLSALLAKVLLVFATEYERESDVSLAISANVLRVLDVEGVQVRELPRLSGVSKEAIAMAQGFLEKQGYIVVESGPSGSRFKVARLTSRGLKVREAYQQLVAAIEQRWRPRYGELTLARLRDTLEQLVGAPGAESPLFQGLQPYPDGWRAQVARPETLPRYPMVLHRGGYPDGS
jgi:DNA-binding MarR family transcriptional regulator